MYLSGENTLLRVYVNVSRHWHGLPLHEALVLHARKAGMRGATVLECLAGFDQGATTRGHGWLPRPDREVIVELVDAPERIDAFLRQAASMLSGTVTTLERAEVLHYRQREQEP